MKIQFAALSILSASMLLSGCGESTSTESELAPYGEEASVPDNIETASAETATQNQLQLRAVGLQFEGPDTIPAGWTRIELENVSGMTHFAIVERLPEGITTADQNREVAPPFQEGMNLIAEGDMDGAMAAFGQLPDWFGDIIFMGGPGLVTGDTPISSTLYLEPGVYSIECYVKTGGVFHSYNPDGMGMFHQLTVTETEVETAAPQANAVLDISNAGYALTSGELITGENTIQVNFIDQTVYTNFVGHDVHVVRLDDVDEQVLIDWMNWSAPGGLETPAPAEFVGGLNEMPAGSTGYFSVSLQPGQYALIAEIPNADVAGFYLPFSIEG